MMKLNNKGMSVVELLASFVIVALIITTLYTTMNNFGDKRVEESAKETVLTYKNLITKEIYDDIINKGLISVDKSGVTDITRTAMLHFGKTCPDNMTKYCVNGTGDSCTSNTGTCVEKNALLSRVVFTFRDSSQKVLIVAKGSSTDIVAYGAENDLHIYDLPSYDGTALRVGNVKSSLDYPIFNFEMRFEHPLFSQKYGVFIRAIINIDSGSN